MSVYFLGMTWFYFSMAALFFIPKARTPIFCIGMFPLVCLASFRGIVGTDTYAYFWAFADAGNGYDYGGEPFFRLIVNLLWSIEPNPWFVLCGMSCITSTTLVVGLLKLRRAGDVLALIVVPLFYLDMTMNGLRYGLAFAFFILGASYLREGRKGGYLVIALLGVCSHFSSFLLFALYYALYRGAGLLTIGGGLVAALVGAWLLQDYLMDKRELYSTLASPSALSGLVPFAVGILVLFCIWIYRRELRVSARIHWIAASLVVGAFVVARFSYAGLRFQFVAILLLSTYACAAHWEGSRNKFFRFGLIILLIGMFGFIGRLRNFVDEEGVGNSPFLPFELAPYMKSII